MIPVDPDWPRIMAELRESLMDKQLVYELMRLGVRVEKTTLRDLRIGRNKNPRYRLGAALMNLHEKR